MDAKTRDRHVARARVMKALAHPTRIFIIEELASGEQCVCELQAKIGADMSTVSKHLAQLRDSGIIRNERRGAQVYYSLQATCIPRLMLCVENVVKDNARRYMKVAK